MRNRIDKYGSNGLDIYNDSIRADFQPKGTANIIDLITGFFGFDKQKDAHKDAIRSTEFRPFNVRTSAGNVGFDINNRTIDATMDPMLEGLRRGLFRSAFGQLAGMDPSQTRTDVLGLLRQQAAPQERQQFLDLESRLVNQGQLGLNVGGRGNPMMRALFEAQGQADLGRQISAYDVGLRQQQASTQGLQGLLSGIGGIDQQVNELIKLGLLGGAYGAQAGANQAKFQTGLGDIRADEFGSIGDVIGSVGKLFGF